MFSCDFCHEKYDQESSLLRHITHKKVCCNFYGEDRVSQMKRQSRLLSKRKWHRNHPESRSSEKTVLKKAKQKKTYIPVHIIKSDEGQAFSKFYELIYHECESNFINDVLCDKAYDAVYDVVYNKAMDMALKSDDYIKAVDDLKEDDQVEQILNTHLDQNFHAQIDQEIDEWIKTKQLEMYEKCYKRIEKQCFSLHFQDFCDNDYAKFQTNNIDMEKTELESEVKKSSLSRPISNLINTAMHKHIGTKV